jgi:acyl dehydratase
MMDQHTDRGIPVLRFGPCRVATEDVLAFAAAFDPQPAHLDEHAARATPLGGLAASGWHTCALIARDLEKALADNAAYLGTAAVDELRWLRPVRPDDELFGEVRWGPPTLCVREPGCECRPAWVEARNNRGEVVVRWSCHMLFGQATKQRKANATTSPLTCDVRRLRPAKVLPRRGEHFIKYFEDVVCGEEIALGSYVFDASNVAMFESIVAGEGKRPGCDALCGMETNISGWNVVAAWMSLIVAYYERRANELAAAGRPVPALGPATGVKWLRWLAPVSLGDRISFRGWVEHKVKVGSRGRWGLLVAGGEGCNERGEIVVSLYPQFLLERQPSNGMSGSRLPSFG